MKIAILGSRGYPSTYGGFETLVRYLAPYLRAHGHAVEVYGRTAGFATWGRRPQSIDGITVRTTAGLNATSTSTLSFGLTSVLHAALRSRPDVVIAVNVAMGHYLRLMRWAGIPTILNVDGMEWERGKWGPAARRVFRLGAAAAARDADLLVADSQEVGRQWHNLFGRRPVFIPYGGEALSDIDVSLLEANGLEKDRYILYVARLVPENSITLALAAAEHVRTKMPLVVVGSSHDRDELQQLAARAHADGRIRWLGHIHSQPQLHALWRNCAAYVHGHTSGGTNPALLQAMANRAAVVALDTPFSREVLGPDYPLCQPTPESLASGIDRVLSSDQLRQRLKEQSARRVAANYVWDAVCGAYEAAALALADGP